MTILPEYPESQAGESPVLRALLADDPVVYVEVGAGDWGDWNETWPFYAAGGHGLLIEPRIELHDDYALHRPRDIVSPYASYSERAVLPLRMAVGATSLRADWNIDHIVEKTVMVQAEPLATILAETPDIAHECRFCTIDVEGAEREALLGIDWATFQPDVLMVEYIRYESNRVGENISSEWRDLIPYFYRECCRSWLNIIFLRVDRWNHWETNQNMVRLPHKTLDETRAAHPAYYGVHV